MNASLKSPGIDQLSVEERLALVEELWNSIAEDSAAVPLTDARRAELDRRLADHEARPDDVVSWDDVKSSIAARAEFDGAALWYEERQSGFLRERVPVTV